MNIFCILLFFIDHNITLNMGLSTIRNQLNNDHSHSNINILFFYSKSLKNLINVKYYRKIYFVSIEDGFQKNQIRAYRTAQISIQIIFLSGNFLQSFIMLFKIVLKNQIRVFDCKDAPTLSLIYQFINKTFPKLKDVYLYYCDEDGDHIVLESDIDLSVYLQVCGTKPKIYIRLAKEGNSVKDNSLQMSVQNIKKQVNISLQVECSQRIETKQEHKEEEIKQLEMRENVKEHLSQEIIQKVGQIHEVKCDQCGLSPIIGIIYKCGVCLDFDLCQKCQQAKCHDHPLIKIRYACQTPLKIKFQFSKPENDKRPVVNESKSEQIKYESEEQRSQLIISYLQNLMGDKQDELYEFSMVSNSLTFDELFVEYLDWLQNRKSRVPKFLKWWRSLIPSWMCKQKDP